jgi:hypothetical protein
MDVFEQVVSEILWIEGFWVRTSVKVDLTKEEKVRIGRPSSPRWELDIVGYGGRDNTLRVGECKSYLDSRGVALKAFDGTDTKSAERYKLFSDDNLRAVVFERLRQQLAECGACASDATVKLCLACGRIPTNADHEGLQKHFTQKGWELWNEKWLREKLQLMSERGYENQVSAVVAKLLLRGKVECRPLPSYPSLVLPSWQTSTQSSRRFSSQTQICGALLGILRGEYPQPKHAAALLQGCM